MANYHDSADWNSQDGNVTTVGSAGPLSASYWGTYDQAGNVREWAETLDGARRWTRGGSYADPSGKLRRTAGDSETGTKEVAEIGFRVGTIY